MPEKKPNKNVLVGLLGRTAPMAAKTLDSWSPEQLRMGQLTWVETVVRPSWKEVQSGSPALRA